MKPLIAGFVLIFAIIMTSVLIGAKRMADDSAACKARGGTMVRLDNGRACIKVDRIQLPN